MTTSGKSQDQRELIKTALLKIDELQAKLKVIGQPYIDRMNADPLNAEAIHAELTEKVAGIVWEYTLRMDAKNSNR